MDSVHRAAPEHHPRRPIETDEFHPTPRPHDSIKTGNPLLEPSPAAICPTSPLSHCRTSPPWSQAVPATVEPESCGRSSARMVKVAVDWDRHSSLSTPRSSSSRNLAHPHFSFLAELGSGRHCHHLPGLTSMTSASPQALQPLHVSPLEENLLLTPSATDRTPADCQSNPGELHHFETLASKHWLACVHS
jgi:hypothetical protein